MTSTNAVTMLLQNSLRRGSAFSAGFADLAIQIDRWTVLGSPELASVVPSAFGVGAPSRGNELRLAAYLESRPATSVLVEDMLVRREDEPPGSLVFSGDVAMREVPIATGGEEIVKATSWVLNAFLLRAHPGLPDGASLDSAQTKFIYGQVLGVIVGAFDGEGYVAYEISRV